MDVYFVQQHYIYGTLETLLSSVMSIRINDITCFIKISRKTNYIFKDLCFFLVYNPIIISNLCYTDTLTLDVRNKTTVALIANSLVLKIQLLLLNLQNSIMILITRIYLQVISLFLWNNLIQFNIILANLSLNFLFNKLVISYHQSVYRVVKE